jgi:hypothetical protein
MKNIAITLLFNFLFICLNAQIINFNKKNYLSVSGGSVAFGTGDIWGVGICVSYGTDLTKTTNNKLGKLIIDAEIIFETGTVNPKIENITLAEFGMHTFKHVSNIFFYA